MDRMRGIDAGFLYMETPTAHMHTIKVALVAPAPDAGDPVRRLDTVFSFSEDLFGFDPPFSIGDVTASPDGTTYRDGQGNTYSSVPEPALSALALTALAFLGIRLRRRRA